MGLGHQIAEVKSMTCFEANVKIKIILHLENKVEILDREICDLISEKNAEKIRKHYSNLTDFGSFNIMKMWQGKKTTFSG